MMIPDPNKREDVLFSLGAAAGAVLCIATMAAVFGQFFAAGCFILLGGALSLLADKI